MFKANVGSSTNGNPKNAGKEAAVSATRGLSDVKVVFLYASCEYDLKKVIEGVKETLPKTLILGNTSFTGIITPEGYIGGNNPFVGILAFDDPDMSVGIAAIEKNGSAEENGKSLAKAAMASAGKSTPPDYFYMAASPAEEEFYLKGISSIIGRIPFFGGSSADNSISGKWKLYADSTVFSDGAIVAFFYNGPKMNNLFTGAYHETNDFGVITKVTNNRNLVEIDGIPATKKYAQWLGLDMDAVTGCNLLVTAITSPLGVKDRLGDLIAIRHPMNGNDDFSMAIGNNLSEKTCIIRMEATVDELIDSAGKTLTELISKIPGKPLAFHLVHCGGRRAGIGDRIDEVAEGIKLAAGDIPYIVEFTFGEYGFESDNNNTCGGLMLSFTGFYE